MYYMLVCYVSYHRKVCFRGLAELGGGGDEDEVIGFSWAPQPRSTGWGAIYERVALL